MAEFWQTVCPIWFRVRNGYELHGSGVLLRIGGSRFLASAAHVLDRILREDGWIGLPGGYFQIPLDGKLITPPHEGRKKDHVDVGFISLGESLASTMSDTYAFLPVHCLEVLDDGKKGTPYIINGCPSKKVEKTDKTFRPQLYEFRTTGLSHNTYAALGLIPERQIAMEFDRKRMKNGLGQLVQSPKPNGVSGGPVWKMVSTTDASGNPAFTKSLAGIVIEHDEGKRLLIATRIVAVLAGIAHAYPVLARHIPQNPNLTIVCGNKPLPEDF